MAVILLALATTSAVSATVTVAETDAAPAALLMLAASPPSSAPPVGVATSLTIASDDLAFLEAAVDRRVGECMEAAGFVWIYSPLSSFQAQSDGRDVDTLAEYPYDAELEGLPYRRPQLQVVPPIEQSEAHGPAAAVFSESLLGTWDDVITIEVLGVSMQTPRGGCLTAARLEVFGSLEAALLAESEASNALALARQQARSAPAVLDAMGDWAACMSASGFAFADFTEARARARLEPALAVQLARSDAACTESSGLAAVFGAEVQRQVDSLLDANPTLVVDLEAAIAESVERATQILMDAG